MQIYYLSGNGQQVYYPVMEEDWRHKISSNYGWRVHPISKEKKFHDGVDIAVPTGTGIYSPVSGTVTRSYYSDSGGNMITIQTETGWNITFMHMDSRSVSAGQHIEQGQYMGASGNTGNSTYHIFISRCMIRRIIPSTQYSLYRFRQRNILKHTNRRQT